MTVYRLCAFAMFAAALSLVVGCVPVKNVIDRWNVCDVDGALVGTWVGDDDAAMALQMHDEGYVTLHDADDMDAKPGIALRTFELGGQDFLLMVQYDAASSGFDETVVEDAPTGVVLMYTIEGDTMVWSTLRSDVIADAIDAEEVAGEIIDGGEAALDSLDDDTLAWLAEAFADEENLEEDTLSFIRQGG